MWPNGSEFGDACDPSTDTDNDGFSSGFCGGYTDLDDKNVRLCNVDLDCQDDPITATNETFVPPINAPETVKNNAQRCRKLPASTATKLDNCSGSVGVQRYDPDPLNPLDNDQYDAGTFITTYNPGQEDNDRDFIGDICDSCVDTDHDFFTDSIINEGFENGLGQWKLFNPDKPLIQSSNYRHLDDSSLEPRTAQDVAYRGVHAAWIQADNATPKRMILKMFLPGPARAPDVFDDRVWYTARAWVKSTSDPVVPGTGQPITFSVKRGCTNALPGEDGIPYSAKCKGQPFSVSDTATTDGWMQLSNDFYVNYETAQNEVAFVFDVSAVGKYFIDDFQIFYKSNVARNSDVSCAIFPSIASRPDNCSQFNNPSKCFGGEKNGQSCNFNNGNNDCLAGGALVVGKFASCLEIRNDDATLPSGYYDIYPGRDFTKLPEKVYCDMATDGGGWTLVARINDGDIGGKHWSAYTNAEMGGTWWFNGGSGGVLQGNNADYKAQAFDSLPFIDLMVTVHKDSDGPTTPIYGIYAKSIGDPSGIAFANQPIWTSPACALNIAPTPIKSGSFGNEAVLLPGMAVNGLILGAKDGNNNDDALGDDNDEEPTGVDVCVKKIDLSAQGISNYLINKDPATGQFHYQTGGVTDTESPEFSVIGFASDTDPKNTGPLGVGNFHDGGNVGGMINDFSPTLKPPFTNKPLFDSANYAMIWFREGGAAGAGSGNGICQQLDFDEDNIGDSCDICTDRDNDTFGDKGYDFRGCKGSFSKYDNCPITGNPDQADYDNDTNTCNLTGNIPYAQGAKSLCRKGFEDKDPCCNDPKNFKPQLCNFCGGDACDLDADGDRCYNWEQTRRNPFNNGFSLPPWSDIPNNLAIREEGYLPFGNHDEKNWLSFSNDSDNDGLPSDCDAQTCGNGVLENIAAPLVQCQNFPIGARQCEECDVNDFGIIAPCDAQNPINPATTLRSLYPIKKDPKATFIAHFDDTANALNDGGIIFPSKNTNRHTFTTGLTDTTKTLGKALVVYGTKTSPMNNDDLEYPAQANGIQTYNLSDKGTINLWVKPMNRDVDELVVHGIGFERKIPVGWAKDTWHMISAVFEFQPLLGFSSYVYYVDGRLQFGDVPILPVSDPIPVTYWLYILGLQIDVPGDLLDVALDEAMILNYKLDDSQIRALYNGVFQQCLSEGGTDISKYMTANFCASCNTLQCQINTLRTCLPLEGFNLDTSKIFNNPELAKPENIIEFIWAHSNYASNNVRKVNAQTGANEGIIYGRAEGHTIDVDNFHKTLWLVDRDITSDSGGVTEYRYDLAERKNCRSGDNGNQGVYQVAVDTKGNSWAYVGSGEQQLRFEYSRANNRDCTNATGGIRWITQVGGDDPGVKMIVDSDNHLWVIQPNYDRTLRIDLNKIYNGDTIAPGNYAFAIARSTCSINGDRSACRYYNTTNPRDITFDALGTAWISHSAGIYKVPKVAQDSGDMQNLRFAGILFSPWHVAVDINNHLWVANQSKNGGGADNLLIQIDTEIDKETGITADPPGRTPIYGLAADTLGNIWAKHNGTEISRFKASDGSSTGIFEVYGTKMLYSGLTPRILSVYAEGRTFEIPFDLEAVSTANGKWLNRWGKILYDVDPVSATDKIIARVSLSDDVANLGNNWIEIKEFNDRISGEPPISMDEYMAMSDADKDSNKNRELTGKYLKIRFTVDANEGEIIKVKNVRITCRDAAGRNICL